MPASEEIFELVQTLSIVAVGILAFAALTGRGLKEARDAVEAFERSPDGPTA